ncbi:UNVERIFIED_CONTAM: hypothetical protein Sradi_0904500 [Sesamum radiatum]|uniref:Uncharacterized protein n=1 Tax=Sesamum radiatum TaxID=300843 RepID=A0AAW2V3F6_SESRA
MLDVRDMSEEDKLFNFLSGLQTWAQTELRRQGVKDLPSAISAADRLVDFRVTNNSDPERKEGFWKGEGEVRTKKGCYLCNGDHRMRDCPKRGKLNALVAEADDERVDPLGSILCSWIRVPLTTLWLIGRFRNYDSPQHSSRIKAVNSEAKPIQGAACVELKGTYLQDSVRSTEKKDSLMSAMQVKAGLRRGDQTYLAALIEIKPDVVQEVPDEVAELLQEFKDVFPPELPKKLPPRRAIDHAIELEPGARPPAQAPYRMAPAELAELRKQLDGLLEAGLVQPSKAPYGSPFCSKGSKMVQ